MSALLEQCFQSVDETRDAILARWKRLTDIDSGSSDKAGVDAVSRLVEDELRTLGFSVRVIDYEKAGRLLIADFGDEKRPPILLVGHLDTVFKKGTACERPFTIDKDCVRGPGVLDMKGGVTVMLSALRTLIMNGWRGRVRVLLAGDEEVGHRSSNGTQDLIEAARGARFGLNFEPGFPDNAVVVERKGVANFRVDVKGIGAHVGNAPEEGRSAITELAAKIADINALTDREKGTYLNVGVIDGGTVPNACPEQAWCVIDLRFKTAAELERVRRGLRVLETYRYVDRTETVVTESFVFPAMERLRGTMLLLERANRTTAAYGFPEMKPIAVGGGSDSATLTACGVPVLDAMGVRGRRNHTVEEYAELESVFERTKLACALLAEL